MITLRELIASWPERAIVPVRLHLYGDDTYRIRCDLKKLRRVFKCAQRFNVQVDISTGTNQMNAVYVMLDNYVLRADMNGKSNFNWGCHYQFLLALAKMFPGNVFVDPPKYGAEPGKRYCIDQDGEIIEVIQTWDAV